MEISPESGPNLTPGPNLVPTSGPNLSHCKNWAGPKGPNLSARPYTQRVAVSHSLLYVKIGWDRWDRWDLIRVSAGKTDPTPRSQPPFCGPNVGTQTPENQPLGLRHIGEILPAVLKSLRKQAPP